MPAQDRVAAAGAVLADHAHPFEPDPFTGPGAAWLIAEAARAEIACLGESHGNRQTPALTASLLDALRPHGYGAYAIEAGPVSTRILVAALREGGVDAGVAWMRAHPFAIAFMGRREEIEAAGAAVERGYAVWGLDQEFVGCGRHLLAHGGDRPKVLMRFGSVHMGRGHSPLDLDLGNHAAERAVMPAATSSTST